MRICVRTSYIHCGIFIIAGISILPYSTHAFFTENLRKLHEQRIEQRADEREQFRQEVIERRKEFLIKWHEKKRNIKEKFEKDKQRIESEFSSRSDFEDTATMTLDTELHKGGNKENDDFFATLYYRVNNLLQRLLVW